MEDALIQALIDTATTQVQTFTRRAFLRGSYLAKLNYFPAKITLDVLPIDVDSVVVKYFDADNAEQTLAAEEYNVIYNGPDDYATIEFNGSMPAVYDKKNAVSIAYDAGYAAVPAPIKTAILMQVATMYENRQDEVVGASGNAINFGSQQILFPYKIFS